MENKPLRAICEVDFDNLNYNLDTYKKVIKKGVKICAVVKANAYGHGSIEVAKELENKVDYFAVATCEEALELRNKGIKNPLLILGYVPKFQIKKLIEKDIEIPLYSVSSVEDVMDVCSRHNLRAKVHIKLDTGMSRIGFVKERFMDDLQGLIEKKELDIRGIFSHFSKADEKNQEFTQRQFDLFVKMTSKLEEKGFSFPIKHIANSAGAFSQKYQLDMVRLGIGLYGYNPFSFDLKMGEKAKSLKPIMSLSSLAYEVKKIPKETCVGYGGRYISKSDEWIATIPIGYADGVFRNIGCRDFKVQFENGDTGVIVGNICMDQMMVKVKKPIPVMTRVYIFNSKTTLNADYMAKITNTIAYEVLCSIQRRVPRLYTKNGKKWLR